MNFRRNCVLSKEFPGYLGARCRNLLLIEEILIRDINL